MRIVLAEFQGRGILWQGGYVHAEKIHSELTVDIVKLILVFAVLLF